MDYVLKEFYGIETTKTQQVEIANEIQILSEKYHMEISAQTILGVYNQICKL